MIYLFIINICTIFAYYKYWFSVHRYLFKSNTVILTPLISQSHYKGFNIWKIILSNKGTVCVTRKLNFISNLPNGTQNVKFNVCCHNIREEKSNNYFHIFWFVNSGVNQLVHQFSSWSTLPAERVKGTNIFSLYNLLYYLNFTQLNFKNASQNLFI